MLASSSKRRRARTTFGRKPPLAMESQEDQARPRSARCWVDTHKTNSLAAEHGHRADPSQFSLELQSAPNSRLHLSIEYALVALPQSSLAHVSSGLQVVETNRSQVPASASAMTASRSTTAVLACRSTAVLPHASCQGQPGLFPPMTHGGVPLKTLNVVTGIVNRSTRNSSTWRSRTGVAALRLRVDA